MTIDTAAVLAVLHGLVRHTQMAQLDNDRMADVAKDLRDTQAKLLEVIPRLTNAQAVLRIAPDNALILPHRANPRG